MIKEKKRKTRSDKKRDVKPTIPVELYECIDRISYLTTRPVKDVGEELCKAGLANKEVIEYLSTYFRRDFWATRHTLYRGNPNNEIKKLSGAVKRRITIRFQQPTHDRLAALAYSLDQTVSSATALLLHATVKNAEIVNEFIAKNIEKQLEPNKRKELKKIIKFINNNNPYEEEFTLSVLVNLLVDEVMNGAQTVKETISNWINEKTK